MNKAFTDCLHAATAVVRFPVPGLRWSAGVRSRRVLEEYFHTNIDARRTSGGDDLFAALCRARDEDGNQFTDDDVVNHMIFLMSAATDTSAAAATAVLHQLALHPEWQDRVRAESSAEIGDGRLDLDALDRMQSLGMVINESMRLFAPVPAIFRKTLADTSIQGYFVPADTMVVVAPLLNHYWPGLWSDPHAFDPERFSDARREDRSHRLAFMPFGAGAHKCIGMHFATMVVKVVIHHLLRDHRIEMRPGYTLEWDMTALPAPTDDFPVLIRRVDDSSRERDRGNVNWSSPMEFTYFLSFNRLVSKCFYRIQTRLFAADDVVFLNIGYEEDPPMALPLAESDEPNRFYIQLYHRIATQAETSGANGCWRSVAATAAEPPTSCAPCTRPPTQGWT